MCQPLNVAILQMLRVLMRMTENVAGGLIIIVACALLVMRHIRQSVKVKVRVKDLLNLWYVFSIAYSLWYS